MAGMEMGPGREGGWSDILMEIYLYVSTLLGRS